MGSNNKIPKEKRSVCVSFRCTEEVYELLTDISDVTGWSVSKLVSVIVSQWLVGIFSSFVKGVRK